MRLFQVTIPEDRGAEVYQLLKEEHEVPHIARVHANNLFVYSFRVHNEKTNSVLKSLQKAGVGRHFGYIDILPIETSIPMTKPPSTKKKTPFFKKEYGVSERITVEAIYNGVIAGTYLSFDFLTLLVTAALIASAGLASNSVVSVVASMLVSPLMGPILGFSFGALIKDTKLIAIGLKNEVIALSIIVCVGFLTAFMYLPFGPYLGFPNNEQSGRGDPYNLIFGVLVASPSGVGVALSLTSSSVSSLIGVAISASLLPPAVNAGMCFNYGIFGPLVHGADAVNRYQMFAIAGVSFSLTMVNIACLNIFAMLWFKIKRIVPMSGEDKDIFQGFYELEQKSAYLGDANNPYQDEDKVEDIMHELEAVDALP